MKIISTIKTNNSPKWLPARFSEFRIYFKFGKKINYFTFYGTGARMWNPKMSREEQIKFEILDYIKNQDKMCA
jgi:hypothetical protein